MCGIAGWLSWRNAPSDGEGVIRRMTEAMHHRGPDADGYFLAPPFAGGMRRLSINDVEGGDQPLFNEDGSVILFYNGEIYNQGELRAGLEARGHRFATRCDGEVICHLFEEVGQEAFERLDGMFAVALWSVPDQTLYLARDFAGEKPLHYARLSDGGVVFGSEIRALKAYPGLALSLNMQAIWDFPTFLWIPEPATVYEQVHALPPGHTAAISRSGLSMRELANRFAPRAPCGDREELVARTRELVTASVRDRLLSDVPLGCFLSSGLDSSIVASVAAAHVQPLRTYSIGFEPFDDAFHGKSDESVEATAFARKLGTRHEVVHVTGETFREALPLFCRHGDQPFAVSSGLGILAIAKCAHDEGIKVLLSGDGADELFGGYSWYPYLARKANGVALPDHTVSFQNTGLPLESRIDAIADFPGPKRAWAWHYYAAEEEKNDLFAAPAFEGVQSSLRHFEAFDPSPDWAAETFVRHDRAFYLPFEMMRKLDRMTSAWSVEGRAPFVSPALLGHVKDFSHTQLVNGETLKPVLREAFKDQLPPEVSGRPKHGFNVPIDHWLKGAWADLLDAAFAPSSALSRAGFLAKGAAGRARRLRDDPERLNGHTLFCYIMLDMWLAQEVA